MPLRRRSFAPTAVVVGALLGLVLASCGSGAIPDDVVRQLDTDNTLVAVIGELSEQVPGIDLYRASVQAAEAGTELRFVIAGDDAELVNPGPVAKRYGGTVLSYKTGTSSFEAASESIDNDQLVRAVAVADNKPTIAGSALAFSQALLQEGGAQAKRGGTAGWVWLLLVGAIVFVLWQLWSYLRARKRADRRRENFQSRKDILRDWAQRLAPEVDTLLPHYSQLDGDGRRMLDESSTLVDNVVPAIDEAVSLGELDASEIRIARTAIKLRTIRQTLTV